MCKIRAMLQQKQIFSGKVELFFRKLQYMIVAKTEMFGKFIKIDKTSRNFAKMEKGIFVSTRNVRSSDGATSCCLRFSLLTAMAASATGSAATGSAATGPLDVGKEATAAEAMGSATTGVPQTCDRSHGSRSQGGSSREQQTW
jgi:hypothetical protein